MIVISLSGRKGCGKSELSKACFKRGFKILSFADSLKNLTCQLLGYTREELNERKESEIDFICSEEQMIFISEATGISLEKVIGKLKGINFPQPRHILQYIGTELIREYCPTWHIDKTRERIVPGFDYVIDDTRFPNERTFLEREFNAICFYVIRPSQWKISNHESETSLDWTQFGNNVIDNSRKLEALLKRWNGYLDIFSAPYTTKGFYGTKDKMQIREILANELKTKTTEEIGKEVGVGRNAISDLCSRLMVEISREKYEYDETAFLQPDAFSAYCFGLLMTDGSIKLNENKTNSNIEFTNNDYELMQAVQKVFKTDIPIRSFVTKLNKVHYIIVFSNHKITENLKKWEFQPLKPNRINPPSIIVNDIELVKQWIVGLIDGDGSVCICGRALYLHILATKSIIEFIDNISPVKASSITREKNTFLYRLTFFNHLALDFHKWLDPKFGLERKWNNIEIFRELNTERRTEKTVFENE